MRRKFFDLHARDNSPSTSAVVKTMAPLRAIKDRICRHGAEGAPASGQNAPPPIVAELLAMLERELPGRIGQLQTG